MGNTISVCCYHPILAQVSGREKRARVLVPFFWTCQFQTTKGSTNNISTSKIGIRSFSRTAQPFILAPGLGGKAGQGTCAFLLDLPVSNY